MLSDTISNKSDTEQPTTITLLGKYQAREGHRFIYQGPIPECRECQLKNICFNLDKGRRYQIVKVREKEHSCSLFFQGVRVVEVVQVPFTAGIPKGMVIEGSVISFHPQECSRRDCMNWSLVHPPGLETNTRIKVLKIVRDINCSGCSPFREALVDFAD